MKRLIVVLVLLSSPALAGGFISFGRYLGGQYGDQPDTQTGALWQASIGYERQFEWAKPYVSAQTIMNGEKDDSFHPSRAIYIVGAEFGRPEWPVKIIYEHMCDHHVDNEENPAQVYADENGSWEIRADHKNQQYNYIGVRYDF